MQSVFHHAFKEAFLPNDVMLRQVQRIRVALGVTACRESDISAVFLAANECGKGITSLVLRTLCNAWTTEARMRDEHVPQSCLLGCRASGDTEPARMQQSSSDSYDCSSD